MISNAAKHTARHYYEFACENPSWQAISFAMNAINGANKYAREMDSETLMDRTYFHRVWMLMHKMRMEAEQQRKAA